MHSTDWSPARLRVAVIAVGLLVAGAAAAGVGVRATYGAQVSADEPQYLLTAISLAEDFDLDIADELSDQRWRAFHAAELPEQTKPLPGGRRVSPHDPLLPLLLALPVAVGGWVGAKLAMAAMLGLTMALTAWTLVHRFAVAPVVALAVPALFGVTAPLAVYGTQIYPEVPAALLVVVGVLAGTGRLRGTGLVLLTAAVAALPWLAIKYSPVAAVLALLGLVRLWREGRRRSAVGVVAVLAAAGAVFVAVHLAVYGGVTAYASGDHFVGGELTAVGYAPNYAGRAVRLVGLLVDREFGLAAWQPAWLLAVPALALLARRPPPHWMAVWAPLMAGWLTATFLALTMHGWWFPGRQAVVVLPLAVMAIAITADRSRVFLALTCATGALGIWSYAWLVAAGYRGTATWIVDFYRVDDPWYRAWSWLLPAYRTATPATWVRHALWLAVVAAAVLLALGLHRGARSRSRT